MAKKRRKLGEILFSAGVVKKQALIDAIKTSRSSDRRLGDVLLELGLIDQTNLTKAIATQFGLKYINLEKIEIPQEVLDILPEDLIMNNGRLKLVINDPLDLEAMDAIRFRLNTDLDCRLASISQIRDYIEKTFDEAQKEEDDRLRHSIDATSAELAEAGHELQAEALKAQAAGEDDDAPIVRLVNLVIDNA
ncbi:MAG: GspE/PulE/PilB domain-containing protein [Planctomycetota bacterium]|jgi:type IV pilus assembly protein PilB